MEKKESYSWRKVHRAMRILFLAHSLPVPLHSPFLVGNGIQHLEIETKQKRALETYCVNRDSMSFSSSSRASSALRASAAQSLKQTILGMNHSWVLGREFQIQSYFSVNLQLNSSPIRDDRFAPRTRRRSETKRKRKKTNWIAK